MYGLPALDVHSARWLLELDDHLARAPGRLAQAPDRAVRFADADPGGLPFDVVSEEPTLVRVRRYDPDAVGADRERNTPLVIVYPVINDLSILDFRPDRSVIGSFLERGFSVYVLEWMDASPIDRSIGLDDVIERTIGRSVRFAIEDASAERAHLLGYSTGAPLAVAYAARRPERVRSLALQGAPVDFDAGGSVGQLRTIGAHLDLETFTDAFDVVPPRYSRPASPSASRSSTRSRTRCACGIGSTTTSSSRTSRENWPGPPAVPRSRRGSFATSWIDCSSRTA